jgi:hypothetical protein
MRYSRPAASSTIVDAHEVFEMDAGMDVDV